MRGTWTIVRMRRRDKTMIESMTSPTSRLQSSVEDRLDAVTAAEQRTALRSLLNDPLLAAQGTSEEKFALVRRHAEWLREWLIDNCGWRLHLDSDFARLQKTPADVADGTRGAVESKSGVTFGR